MKGVNVIMGYYFSIILISMTFIVIQLVHLLENETLERREKRYLRYIAVLIIIGQLCEAVSIYLDNKNSISISLHALVKVIEFTVTPIIPILYVNLVNRKRLDGYIKYAIITVLAINTFFEMLSIFVPIVFYIDKEYIYRHGQYYWIYVLAYWFGIIVFIVFLLKSIKMYQQKTIASLVGMMSLLVLSLIIKAHHKNLHVEWVTISMIYSFFINYYMNMVLKLDALTSLLNRRSYENYIHKIDSPTAIVMLDVNRFKQINDNYGHQCGDECLKAVASVILKVYGKYGYCYRIGGDEFCVILKPDELRKIVEKSENYDTYKALDELNMQVNEELKEEIKFLPMLKEGIAKGYGIFYGYANDLTGYTENRFTANSVPDVIRIADERMYEDKKKNNLEE